jgi:hypothetical protein
MHPLTGKKQSDEHKAKRVNSDGYKNRTFNPWNKGLKGLTPWNKGTTGFQKAWNKGLTGVQVAWNKGLKKATNTGRTHFKKGHVPWSKGKPLSPDQIETLRLANIGKKQSIETRLKRAESLRGKRLGEKSNLWRGGINPLRVIIRDLSESTEWRKNVFERDDYTCKFCGVHGGHLEAHHLKRFTDIFREFLDRYSMLSVTADKYRLVDLARKHGPFWDINNGVTLCRPCHDRTK